MPPLAGPVTAFAVLLVFGGALKLRRPDDTVRALRSLRLPANAFTVRLLALTEVLIGSTTVMVGGRLTALLTAVSYLAFSAFVILAMLRRGPVSSCGCFGTPDTPPTATHLVVTSLASVLAFAAVAHPIEPLAQTMQGQPVFGIPFVVLTGCCVWFAHAALSLVPKVAAMARQAA